MSKTNAVAAIRVMGVFTNNGSTLIGTTGFRGWGDLPDAYRTDVINGPDWIVYWLYSYDTPVAWVSENLTVTMPQVDYSPKTTNHQKIVAEALGIDFQVEESIQIGSCTARPGESAPRPSKVKRRRAVARPSAGIGGLG